MQFLEGAVIIALARIDDPLEALEAGGAGGEDVADSGQRAEMRIEERIGSRGPKAGFDAAQAVEAPLAVDQSVDKETLGGVGGSVLMMIFGGELGEIVGGFAARDLLLGIDAVLQRVEAGYGFARGGARTRWTLARLARLVVQICLGSWH